jgi:hypothetical protein
MPALVLACQSSQQDQSDRRRTLAEKSCEDAVRGQLSSRATAQFFADSEHVYYDSAGGAAVSGTVSTVDAPRKFACLLKPATESTWVLSAARLLN